MKTNKKIFFFIFVLILVPNVVGAQGLLPDCGYLSGSGFKSCGFSDLLQLFQNLVDFVTLKLALPLATITFVYAGFKIMTARDNPAQMKEGRKMLIKTVIGFVILLAAFLIVRLITTSLLNSTLSNQIKL